MRHVNSEGLPDQEGGDIIYLNGSLMPSGIKSEAATPTFQRREEDNNLEEV